MSTIDRARSTRATQPVVSVNSRTQPGTARWPSPATPSPKNKQSGAIDHWSAVLFYSMGVGAVAVAVLCLLVLAAVWVYGQFIWTFTHWDLTDVRPHAFKPFADFLVFGTFLAGTCAGLWCFSGAAWSEGKKSRPKAAAPERRPAR